LGTNQVIFGHGCQTDWTEQLLAVRAFIAACGYWLPAGGTNDSLRADLNATAWAEFFTRLQADLAGRANPVAARRAAASRRIEMGATIGTGHNPQQPLFDHECV
jgi:hypothetical protein